MKPIFLCMAFAIYFNFSFSQSLDLQWANYNHGNLEARCHGLEIDDDGNIYNLIFGFGDIDLDPGSSSSVANFNNELHHVVQKLDANGNLDWVAKLPGHGSTISLDIDDGLIITGNMGSGTYDMDPTPGVDSISVQNSAAYIIHLDSYGQYISHSIYSQLSAQILIWNVVDKGSLGKYVFGWVDGVIDMDLGPGVSNTPSGRNEIVMKLDANNDFDWMVTYPDSNFVISNTILRGYLDQNNNIILVHRSDGSTDVDPGPSVNMKYDSGINIIKLDANGQYLDYIPLKLDFEYNHFPRVTNDFDGNWIVSGALHLPDSVDLDPSSNEEWITTNNGIGGGYLVKYDPQGNLLWSNYFQNDPMQDETKWIQKLFYSMEIDNDNNIYTIGSIQGTVNMDPIGSNFISSIDSCDAMICQYSPNGDLNFAFTLEGQDHDYGLRCKLGPNEDLVVVGSFEGDCDFDPSPNTHILQAGGLDLYTMKFKPNSLGLRGEMGGDDLTVYPNPVSSILNISGLRGAANLKIFNTQGQLLKEIQNFSDGSIDFSTFDSGIYILSIELGGQIITKRIIRS